MHSFAEKLKFFAEFLRAPAMVGSVLPTSPRVIDRLLDGVDWEETQLFVEYGPGIGTFTRPILDRLPANARFIAIDTNEAFIAHLRQTIKDPRLDLVCGSAADVEAILERLVQDTPADYVLSGLPFSTLPKHIGDTIIRATHRVLRPQGAFLVYQYSGFFIPLLRPYFAAITKARIWRNIPPCLVTAARK